MSWFKSKSQMVGPNEALSGRQEEMVVPEAHLVLGTPLRPESFDRVRAGDLCNGLFLGSRAQVLGRRRCLHDPVGYSGGFTPNPTYEEVCSGRTGHAEAVLVVFDPQKISYDRLLSIFWENHNPTQGMRQGNDAGTQYRSAIYTTTPPQQQAAERSRDEYQSALDKAGLARSRPRSSPPGLSITPRTTTSSTSLVT